MVYIKGDGVNQSYTESKKWFRLAADQGNDNAQSKLGEYYAPGVGVPKNFAEAAKWLHMASQQGNTLALYQLADIYKEENNCSELAKWYDLATEQGSSQEKLFGQESLDDLFAEYRDADATNFP